MSTEAAQQPSISLVSDATPSQGRGRGRGRSRGRGRGQGIGHALPSRQTCADGAPVNVVDHQSGPQPPSAAGRLLEISRAASSSAGHLPATDRRSTLRNTGQQEQQHVSLQAQSSQGARQLQPRHRSHRPRHRGPRQHNEQAQHASLDCSRPDTTFGVKLPVDSNLELPDCVICCEALQARGNVTCCLGLLQMQCRSVIQ